MEKVIIRLVKTDPELIEKLANKIKRPKEEVKEWMLYNVFTINQFADLSQLTLSTVNYKTRPALVKGEIVFELDVVYPFRDSRGKGQKFILRNEKSEQYLK